MTGSELFQAYLDGNEDALIQLLNDEQAELFDYMMRMCGDIGRATDTLHEVSEAIVLRAKDYSDYTEFKVALYQTARNFSADVWSADTSQLENEGLDLLLHDGDQGRKQWSFVKSLETAFRALRGPEREPLVLHDRLGFSKEETARIMATTVNRVDQLRAEALLNLEEKLSGRVALPGDLTLLAPHPLAVASSHSTVAISQLIANVDRAKARGLLASGLKLLLSLVVLLILLAGAYYFMSTFVGQMKQN